MGTSMFIHFQTKFLLRDVLATHSVFQKSCWCIFFLTVVLFIQKIRPSSEFLRVPVWKGSRDGRGENTVEGDYFMATHCTTAVAGLSQMLRMYHQCKWRTMRECGWLSSLRNHDWENNYLETCALLIPSIIFSMKPSVMGLEITIWIASSQL